MRGGSLFGTLLIFVVVLLELYGSKKGKKK